MVVVMLAEDEVSTEDAHVGLLSSVAAASQRTNL